MTSSSIPPDPSLHHRYCLVIHRQPFHVFSGESFEIEFGLARADPESITRNAEDSNSPPSAIDITAFLESHVMEGASSDPALPDETTFEVLQEPRISPRRQTGKLVARIHHNVQKERNAFVIRLDAKGDVQGTQSAVIYVVRAKLNITTPSDWPDPVWYKDEGGRDKCMEVTVTITDKESQRLHETTPLRVELFYEAKPSGRPTAVLNQDILRLLGSSRILELDSSGQTKLRFRVEDVSKNHQGQNFVLKIQPKAEIVDIAPAWTPAVAIRSKRNKRQRSHTTNHTEDFPSPVATAPQPPHHNERLREAVNGITRWSEEVVNGIYPLQWQVMGYAQNADGSYDYNRPYHNMQNPNAFVSRILAIYNSTIRDQLQFLRSSLESSSVFDYEHRSPREAFNPLPGPPQHVAYPPPPPHSTQQLMPIPHVHQHHAAPHPHQLYPVKNEYTYYRDSPSDFPPRADKMDMDDHEDESRVEYVLAKQFKSFSTGEILGFPAYSAHRQIVGFFREIGNGSRQFSSIRKHYFNASERQQASEVLLQEISKKSPAVHALKDWGSLPSLLDHALVYDWSKDLKNPSGRSSRSEI
ncbi:hypothetical protein FisN_7Lh120 [Fistulifera solaris]|uniref:Uncharacterized protein n=1 Tax=Fistulifera solaris TaxID=1519565 RepID=A0A1Z5JCN7_FISSO|nr:hypothetical protein FisN_7Lh120 [Fistulifera solaris]|eukprot:GAX11739.1 hypothetical protein FisN_7Lh120 [Fistulifera solaris]